MNRQKYASNEKAKSQLGCPKCGAINSCGCKSCLKRFPKEPGEFLWSRDGLEDGYEACGKCGHTMHMCEWEDIEYNYYVDHGMWPNKNNE